MNSEQSTDIKTSKRRDWARIAEGYNALEIGHALRLPCANNITKFKQSIVSRGLIVRLDVKVYNRGRVCYVERLTSNKMHP